MPERRDWFNECYAGEQQKLLSPESFCAQFCALCRNAACTNSAITKSRWLARMDSQADRLLNHPAFGDPSDPRFNDIANMPFADKMREALALEISSQKNNWEPVTDAEINAALGEFPKPLGFQSNADPGPLVLWDGQARGTGGAIYRVTLVKVGAEEVWSCTCPAFEYRTGGKHGCKHIVEAMGLYTPAPATVIEPIKENRPEKPPTQNPQRQAPPPTPKAKNTAFPSAGMMIDGSVPTPAVSKPQRDPWTPAAPVVPVGGRVVLGGPKKEDGK